MELRAERREGRIVLLSPGVGVFTCGRRRGEVLTPGETAGVLEVLGRSTELRVPAGAAGRIVNAPPEPVHQPVDWQTVLYELEPVSGEDLAAAETPAARADGVAGPVLRAEQSGRFWHRPTPTAPAFAEPGTELHEGRPVGLIEVMKTFTHVAYHPTGGLPARARLVRMLVADGDEVSAGDALLEVEPA